MGEFGKFVRRGDSAPIEPDFFDATREVGEKIVKHLLVEVLAGHAGDENSVGLGGDRVFGRNEISLASVDKVTILALDDEENPSSEDPSEDGMCNVA